MTCRIIVSILAWFILDASCTDIVYAEESLQQKLAGMGFSDISIAERDGCTYISFDPYDHRDSFAAYRRLTHELLHKNPPLQCIRIGMLIDGIPYIMAQIDSDGKESFEPAFIKPVPEQLNHSTSGDRRFYTLLGIPFNAVFGNFMDPFIFKTGLSVMSRFRASDTVTVFADFDLYVHNEFDTSQWFLPAQLGLSNIFVSGERSLFVTTAGVFPQYNLYGVDITAHHYIREFRNAYLQVMLGRYGNVRFDSGRFFYGQAEHFKSLLRFGWLWETYGADVSVTGGRYLYGDYGAGMDVSRTFGLVSIGVGGTYSDSEFAGKISVSLPLGFSDNRMHDSLGVGLTRHQKYSYSFLLRDTLSDEIKKYGYNPSIGLRFNDEFQYFNPSQFMYRSRLE